MLRFYTLIINYQKEKVKKKILLKIASKIIKYLIMNLTKKEKDLHSENYKTRIEDKRRNGKISHTLGLE